MRRDLRWIHTDKEEVIAFDRAKFRGYEWYLTVARRGRERHIDQLLEPGRHRVILMHIANVDEHPEYCGDVIDGKCNGCDARPSEELLTITALYGG